MNAPASRRASTHAHVREGEALPVEPCEACTTRLDQAVHDLHTQTHSDGGNGCAECRRAAAIVAHALGYGPVGESNE